MFKPGEIIEACKRFEPYAQKEFYEHYFTLARNICRRYISDPDDLKDIVQEGFVKVFFNIGNFRHETSCEGWMKRIFINTALNHLRGNKKTKNSEDIDDNMNASLSSGEEYNTLFYGKEIDKKDIDSEKVDYETVKEADLSKEELMDALNSIPENFRIVFNLYCIDELGHEEIAAVLKINEATSRTRLNRARALLQKILYRKSIQRITRR